MTTKVICDHAEMCPDHDCERYTPHNHGETCDVDCICPAIGDCVKCVPVKEDDRHENT